ncbi:MAG: TonB-dependent receptor, partial [Sphingobium sp.]
GLTNCLAVNPTTSFSAGGEVAGPAQCAFRRRDAFTGVSYTAGVEFKPIEDILLYAKTAKGFRAGGQNLRAPSQVALLPFDPEIAYSYEVGVKAEVLDRRLRINLAAYTSDVNGIQRSTLVSTPPVPPSTIAGTATLVGNAGKARFRGIETEVTAQLFDGFTLSASGSLIEPKYIRYADLSGDRSFEAFNGVSKQQFTLGADYSVPLGEKAQLNLHADYNWRGRTPLDSYDYAPNPNNAAIVSALSAPPTGLLNGRVAVVLDEALEIGVFGRNLTNNRNYTQNQLVAPIGYISATRQEPRTYGVTASYSF